MRQYISPSTISTRGTLAVLHDDIEHSGGVDEAVLVADDVDVLEVPKTLNFCFDVLSVLGIEILDLELFDDEGAAGMPVPR